MTTARSAAVDALFRLAKARLPAALEAKLATFPAAIIDTHGKDLTVSAQPSRQGTPAPPGAASASGSAPAAAGGKKAEPAVKRAEKANNTTAVTVEAQFMAAADDLFGLLTDEKRIPAWTRAPARSTPEPGKEYSLFGGGVTGRFVSLAAPTQFVQTWALSSPTWPSGMCCCFYPSISLFYFFSSRRLML